MPESVAQFYAAHAFEGRAECHLPPWTCIGHRAIWITRWAGRYWLCADPDLRKGIHLLAPATAMADLPRILRPLVNYDLRGGRPTKPPLTAIVKARIV